MLKQTNRLVFLEMVEKEIAEHHVVLSLEGILDRILLESGEVQTEGSSPLASLVECDATEVASMQCQIDPCPARANSQTQRHVTGTGGDVQNIKRPTALSDPAAKRFPGNSIGTRKEIQARQPSQGLSVKQRIKIWIVHEFGGEEALHDLASLGASAEQIAHRRSIHQQRSVGLEKSSNEYCPENPWRPIGLVISPCSSQEYLDFHLI